jgi:ferredoxin
VVIKQHLIDPEICIRCNTCIDVCGLKRIEEGVVLAMCD